MGSLSAYRLNYSLQDVRGLTPYRTVYSCGADYYKEGRVTGIRTEQDAEGYLSRAEARVRGTAAYDVYAELDKKFGIVGYGCTCLAHQKTGAACKHVAALLIALHKNPEEPAAPAVPGGVADPRVDEEVLSALNGAVAVRPRCEDGDVELAPVIEETEGALTLSFRIGRKVLCQVRDVWEFAHRMQEGAVGSYGKTVRFCHCPGAFREDCRPLAEFLARAAGEAEAYHRRFAPYAALPDPRRLTLSPRQTDEFYDLCRDREIAATESVAESGRIAFGGMPGLTFRVSGSRILRLTAEEDSRILRGERYVYVMTDDRLCRCEGDLARFAVPVLEELARSAPAGLRITGPSAPAFVASVLPRLAAVARVEGADLLRRRYPVEPLSASVELSATGEAVFASPRFVYGTTVVSALAPALPGEGRDTVREGEILGLLSAYGFYALDRRMVLDREEAMIRFAERGIEELRALCTVIGGEGFEKLNVTEMGPVSVQMATHAGRLRLSFQGSRFSFDELRKCLEAYGQNRSVVRLRDGTLVRLHRESMEALQTLEAGAGTIRGDKMEFSAVRACFMESLLSGVEGITLTRDEETEALLRAVRGADTAMLEVPDRVQVKLRNYQLSGFRWLAGLEHAGLGGILADEMGLGKTLQVLTLIAHRREGCSLIVCPASLLYNWKKEAERFCPDLRLAVAAGTPEERQSVVSRAGELDLIITSYDLLRNDEELYRDTAFRLCVADEAQYLKNHRTRNAQSIKKIRAQSRFALTGTPIENSLSDLWSIFDFVLPGFLPSRTRFHRQYELTARRDGRPAAELARAVEPFILRRMKTTVLSELPEKIETVLPVPLEEEQRRLYDATLAETRSEFRRMLAATGQAPDTVQFLSLLLRLRQICCHPRLCAPGYEGSGAKTELCCELLHSAIEGGHRVLLFSQFTSMLDLLRERLDREGISYFVLTGQTKPGERLELTERFDRGEADVFLISLKAGGTGLNLTGADVVIHYDPWWNLAAQNQATDRAHRMGQKNRVQVFRLIAEDTVEEQILRLQESKAELSDALIREGGTFISALSREELASLLDL